MIATNKSPVRAVKSWTPVPTALGRWQESSAGLRHVGTTISDHPSGGVRGCGQVLWTTAVNNAEVGIAWSWSCLHGDVVVMTDPMAVVTNLALVADHSGEPLSVTQVMCCLNSVIYSLPWQDGVRSAIVKPRRTPMPS